MGIWYQTDPLYSSQKDIRLQSQIDLSEDQIKPGTLEEEACNHLQSISAPIVEDPTGRFNLVHVLLNVLVLCVLSTKVSRIKSYHGSSCSGLLHSSLVVANQSDRSGPAR